MALDDVWIVGDSFLREINAGLLAFRTAAQVHKKPRPYLFEQYNVTSYYASSTRLVTSTLARIINGLIEGLNNEENKRLPKFVIFIVDKDVLESLKYCDYGVQRLIHGVLQWIINEAQKLLETRREDLRNRREGAVALTTPTNFIWVKMLERPGFCQSFGRNFLSLAWKFNSTLQSFFKENEIQTSLIDITIDKTDFTINGDLTSGGRYNFWKKFLEHFRRIDKEVAQNQIQAVIEANTPATE